MAAPGPVGPRRLVVALAASTFVEWAGAGAMMPLLPLYLRKLGAPVALVGVVMAAFFLAAILVQYPVGRLSDRIGRKPIQLGGLIVFALASTAFALIGSPIAALLVRSAQGAGAGVVDVANNATVGAVVPPSQQGRAYGALFASRTVGLAIGPLCGGLAGLSAMRFLFVVAAVAALAACVPVALVVPSTRARGRPVPKWRVGLWRQPSVLGVAAGYAGAGLVIGVYEVCWSLLLHLRGAHSWQIGLSWTLFAVPFAAASVPAGWLVDHFDRRYLGAASNATSGVFAVIYPFLHSVWLLVGLGVAEAVSVALAGPALAAQLAHSVPGTRLGRAQGAVSSAQTGATGLSALVAGAMFALHPWVPFICAGAAIALTTVVMSLCWRNVPGRGPAGSEPGEPGGAGLPRAGALGAPPLSG